MDTSTNERCIVREGIANVNCQFQAENENIFINKTFKYKDNYYCLFHLPLEGKKTIPDRDTIAHTELRSLREGTTRNGGYWLDYSYVIDDEPYQIKSTRIPNNCTFIFTGAELNGGLTLNLLNTEEVNRISLDKIKTFGSIDIIAKNIINLIINESTFNEFVTFDIRRCQEMIIRKSCFLSGIQLNRTHSSPQIDTLKISEDCSFNKNTFFRKLKIVNPCEFLNINFVGNVEFNECNFELGAQFNCNFDKLSNYDHVKFKNCSFNKALTFTNTTFNVDTEFVEMKSNGEFMLYPTNSLIFNDVTAKAKFRVNISNNSNTKITSIEFNNTLNSYIYEGDFTISNIGCENFLVKNYRIIKDIALNSNDKEKTLPTMAFSYTKFGGQVLIHSLNFKGRTNFEGSEFNIAPIFHLSDLHPDTIFPSRKAFKDHSVNAENAYHTLYTWAAKFKKREYEGIFYALTQTCQRKRLTSCTNWLFSLAYDFISEYGMNYRRPFWAILLLTFIIFPSIYLYFNSNILTVENLSLSQVLPYPILREGNASLQQIVGCSQNPSLDIHQQFKTNSSIYSDKQLIENVKNLLSLQNLAKTQYNTENICARLTWFKFFAVFETITTWILFAIFLLALRWSFKRD